MISSKVDPTKNMIKENLVETTIKIYTKIINKKPCETLNPEILDIFEWPSCFHHCYIRKYFTEDEISCNIFCPRKFSTCLEKQEYNLKNINRKHFQGT